MRNPTGHAFSIQHEKSWLVDNALYLFGSHNGTSNSLLNCEENLGAVCDAGVVARASAHFDDVWAASRPIDENDAKLASAKVRARAKSQEGLPDVRGEGEYQLPPPRTLRRGRSLTLRGTEFHDVPSRSRSASPVAPNGLADDSQEPVRRPVTAKKVQSDTAARMQRLLKSGVLEDIMTAGSGSASCPRPGGADGDAPLAAALGSSSASRGTSTSVASLSAGSAISGPRG